MAAGFVREWGGLAMRRKFVQIGSGAMNRATTSRLELTIGKIIPMPDE
jgi:hypothetical protein